MIRKPTPQVRVNTKQADLGEACPWILPAEGCRVHGFVPCTRAPRAARLAFMSVPIDRESVREHTRRWSDPQRRVLVERVVEHLPDVILERLFEGLVRLDEHRVEGDLPASGLHDRVAAHVAATRRGDFLGDLVIRNKHGQRQPWQTGAWIAATSHLFDLALRHADPKADVETAEALRILVALVAEVDERIDEFVVFEDDCASLRFHYDLQQARALLGS